MKLFSVFYSLSQDVVEVERSIPLGIYDAIFVVLVVVIYMLGIQYLKIRKLLILMLNLIKQQHTIVYIIIYKRLLLFNIKFLHALTSLMSLAFLYLMFFQLLLNSFAYLFHILYIFNIFFLYLFGLFFINWIQSTVTNLLINYCAKV